MTQKELVARAKAMDPHLHLTDSVLGKYENDQAIPRLAEAAAIADVMGVSLDYLTNGEKCQYLSVKGLTEEQIDLLTALTAMLHKLNRGELRSAAESRPTIEQTKLLVHIIMQFMR